MRFWAIAQLVASHEQQTEVSGEEIAFRWRNNGYGRSARLAQQKIATGHDPSGLGHDQTSVIRMFPGLTCAAGIKIVFLAHLANDLRVLATGNKTHHSRRDFAGGDLGFDNVSLPTIIRGVWTFGIDHTAVVDLTLLRSRNRRPTILRRTWILDRKGNRIADDFLFRQRQLAVALPSRGRGTTQSEQALRGSMRRRRRTERHRPSAPRKRQSAGKCSNYSNPY